MNKELEKEKRRKKVKDALAISRLDAAEPNEETLKLMELYINGECTWEEIYKKIIERYSN